MHDAMHSADYAMGGAVSVRLSVTFVYFIERNKQIHPQSFFSFEYSNHSSFHKNIIAKFCITMPYIAFSRAGCLEVTGDKLLVSAAVG